MYFLQQPYQKSEQGLNSVSCACLYDLSFFFLSDEVDVKLSNDKAWLVNDQYGTEPLVAHGNGASKVHISETRNVCSETKT